MDVTTLRLRLLAVEVPPWDFRAEAGHPVEMETEKRLIVISCHRFVVGLVVIDHVILFKCTSHSLSVAQFAQPNLKIGQNSNSILLNICATFSEMTDFEMLSWGKRKPEEAPQGQGRRAVRQAVAEERSERDVTRRLSAPCGRAGDSVSGQRGRTERADRHRVQDVSGSRLGERVRSNGRGGSNLPRIRWLNQEQARSRACRRPRATRSPVRACVGGVPAQFGSDEGAGTRTRGVDVVLGEQRGEERTSGIGGACTALSGEAVRENRGQGRLDAYRVLPGPCN